MNDLLNILQVNSTDIGGGAAGFATSLHQAYRKIGHSSWLVVGHRLGNDPHTLPIRHDLASSWWQRPFWRAENKVTRRRSRSLNRLRYALLMAADPKRVADWYQGYEDFRYPNTANLLSLTGKSHDILHLHNLHGSYFDLSRLPSLSSAVPTILTLHDTWLMSGHCAYSLDCDRWREGCGHCPDLNLYPAILRDATAENWRRKRDIYARSRYHIVAPCQWTANKVAASPLQAGLVDMRVIHHGIDLTHFRLGNRTEARFKLDLPENEHIILMVANAIRHNPWKGFDDAYAAFEKLAVQERQKRLLVLVIGDDSADELDIGKVTVRFIPYVRDRATLAHYYQAADLFLNASIAEVWGMVITEASACGIPVVATDVGGVPEQISSWPENGMDRSTGILVPASDPTAMAGAIEQMLDDESLRQALGQNGARRAVRDFDFNLRVTDYLQYYDEIIAAWNS